MNKAKLLGGASIVALVAVVVVGWVFVRDTQWWADLTESEAAAEVPTDLTEVFNTALVERADVSDEAELVGELRYQDAIDFVHRTDPVISFVTTTTGNGRQAQTVTTTVETPGQRTVTGLPTPGSVSTLATCCTKPTPPRSSRPLGRSRHGAPSTPPRRDLTSNNSKHISPTADGLQMGSKP